MFRAIVPRNCRPAWMWNFFRGMKSNSCQSPWNHIFRNKSNNLWGWNRYQRPFRSFDDHFQGMMEELERNMAFISGRNMRYKQEAKVWCNNKEFEVNIDICHFKPENINVKVTKDKLIISGKHEQKEDEHGSVSREFT